MAARKNRSRSPFTARKRSRHLPSDPNSNTMASKSNLHSVVYSSNSDFAPHLVNRTSDTILANDTTPWTEAPSPEYTDKGKAPCYDLKPPSTASLSSPSPPQTPRKQTSPAIDDDTSSEVDLASALDTPTTPLRTSPYSPSQPSTSAYLTRALALIAAAASQSPSPTSDSDSELSSLGPKTPRAVRAPHSPLLCEVCQSAGPSWEPLGRRGRVAWWVWEGEEEEEEEEGDDDDDCLGWGWGWGGGGMGYGVDGGEDEDEGEDGGERKVGRWWEGEGEVEGESEEGSEDRLEREKLDRLLAEWGAEDEGLEDGLEDGLKESLEEGLAQGVEENVDDEEQPGLFRPVLDFGYDFDLERGWLEPGRVLGEVGEDGEVLELE